MTVVGASSVLTALRFAGCEDLGARDTRRRGVVPHDFQLAGLVEIAVQQEQRRVAVASIDRAGDVHKGHLSDRGDIVARRLDGRGSAHRPSHARAPMHTGSKSTAGPPASIGHQRRDDVHELRETRQPHAIGVTQKRVERAADNQRVAEIVDLLQQMRRLCAGHSRRSADTTRSTRRRTARGASLTAAGRERNRTPRRLLLSVAPSRDSTRETARRP